MSDIEQDVFSLADIADLDSSEVAAIRFESLPAGVYGFKVAEATMFDKDNKDGDPRVVVEFKFEVIEVADFDPESLVGRTHTEKLYIVVDEGQKKALEGIGRVKSFVHDLGCENTGVTREWIEATVDHTFTAKIVERPNPNDRTSPYAQLKLEKRK